MTFWLWFGDKVYTHRTGAVIRGLNPGTLWMAVYNPYEDWGVAGFDVLEYR